MNALRAVRKGDRVMRHLGDGRATMARTVTEVTDRLIVCGPWSFDRDTGSEVDDDLGWGPSYGLTGSFIEPLELEPVRVRLRTETGSVYELVRDDRGIRWSRPSSTLASGPLRSTGEWPLLEWPPRIELGERVPLIGAPYVEGSAARVVITTRVVEITEGEPAERLP